VIDVLGVTALLVLTGGYAWRADFEEYSILTTGSFKRVHRQPATDTDERCADLHCDEVVTDGERRWAVKEVVVAGCPIPRYDDVVAYYCGDHTSFEFQQTEFGPTTTGRLATGLVEAFAAFLVWKQSVTAAVPEDEGPFEDAMNTTASAYSVIAVALIVLITGFGITLVRNARGVLGGGQS